MIFDCFLFYNELDLLELRFCELDHVVDRFVLAEATVTFAGSPKPLFFAENTRLFSEWRHKIIHVIVDDMPEGPNPWAREYHQRHAVLRGLRDAHSEDIIITSDADEIPSADAVRRWAPLMGRHAFDQIFSYYWVNCVSDSGWAGSRIMQFRDVCSYGNANDIRQAPFPKLINGGWHLSYMGGPQRIAAKLEAYSHQELNQSRFKDPTYLGVMINRGLDLFGRDDVKFQFFPIDERFPRALVKRPQRFAHLVCDVSFQGAWYPTSS